MIDTDLKLGEGGSSSCKQAASRLSADARQNPKGEYKSGFHRLLEPKNQEEFEGKENESSLKKSGKNRSTPAALRKVEKDENDSEDNSSGFLSSEEESRAKSRCSENSFPKASVKISLDKQKAPQNYSSNPLDMRQASSKEDEKAKTSSHSFNLATSKSALKAKESGPEESGKLVQGDLSAKVALENKDKRLSGTFDLKKSGSSEPQETDCIESSSSQEKKEQGKEQGKGEKTEAEYAKSHQRLKNSFGAAHAKSVRAVDSGEELESESVFASEDEVQVDFKTAGNQLDIAAKGLPKDTQDENVGLNIIEESVEESFVQAEKNFLEKEALSFQEGAHESAKRSQFLSRPSKQEMPESSAENISVKDPRPVASDRHMPIEFHSRSPSIFLTPSASESAKEPKSAALQSSGAHVVSSRLFAASDRANLAKPVEGVLFDDGSETHLQKEARLAIKNEDMATSLRNNPTQGLTQKEINSKSERHLDSQESLKNSLGLRQREVSSFEEGVAREMNKPKAFENQETKPSLNMNGAALGWTLDQKSVEATQSALAPRASADMISLIDQIAAHISQLQLGDRLDTTVILKNPPLFEGAQLVIQQHSSAAGEFSVTFHNLSNQAASLLANQANQRALTASFQERGLAVHILQVTQSPLAQTFFTAEGQTGNFGERSRDEGRSDHNQSQDEHEKKRR